MKRIKKEEKNKLSKKQKIILISVISAVLIMAITSITLLKIRSSKAGNKDNLLADIEEIPDVTNENTTIELSTLDEAENVVVVVSEKLEDYNLYYYIDNNFIASEEEVKDTAKTVENTVEVQDTTCDYSDYEIYENEILINQNSYIYFVYEKDGSYSKNPYKLTIDNILMLEEVSEEELEKEKVNTANYSGKYYIKVNYGANTVTIYTKDDEGNYTVPVKAMICSCGISTPKGGTYKTSPGFEWGVLMGGVWGQYSTRIVRNILFHSVPYTAKDKGSLEYWEFDKLGTKASAGCVRLQVADAKWIYSNCSSGTIVEFYSDSNPGPLGKPSAPKISNNERCRGWDPTDNAPGNPWYDGETDITVEDVLNGNVITDDTNLND